MFCIVTDLFRTIPNAEPEAWLEIANRARFDVSTCQFVIGMSLHKTVSIRDEEINPIGHLAVRLRGGPINLTVFGKMDKSRYIKPFVVYWN